jgi:cytochrome c oxidase cbb3-type subunit III
MRIRIAVVGATILLSLAFVSCTEQRYHVFRGSPAEGQIMEGVRTTELQPGLPTPPREVQNPHESDPRNIMEGKRLYEWYNCNGCHGNRGGGSIGPPFMDDDWIYGGDNAAVFASIVEGRPQGMPAYGGRLPDVQVWQLVSYVRYLAGRERPEAEVGPITIPSSDTPEQRQ